MDGGLARPGNLDDYVAQLTALLGNAPCVPVGRRRLDTVQQRFALSGFSLIFSVS